MDPCHLATLPPGSKHEKGNPNKSIEEQATGKVQENKIQTQKKKWTKEKWLKCQTHKQLVRSEGNTHLIDKRGKDNKGQVKHDRVWHTNRWEKHTRQEVCDEGRGEKQNKEKHNPENIGGCDSFYVLAVECLKKPMNGSAF